MPKRKTPSNPVKSIINSVESILPEGLNLIHIIVALVIGLAMCSLLDNSIEGFEKDTCVVNDVVDSSYTTKKDCEVSPTPAGTWYKGGKRDCLDNKDCTDPGHTCNEKKCGPRADIDKSELLSKKATWPVPNICYRVDGNRDDLSTAKNRKDCEKYNGKWIDCTTLDTLDSKDKRNEMILCGIGLTKGYEIIDDVGNHTGTWVDGDNSRYHLKGKAEKCPVKDMCAPDKGVTIPSQNIAAWLGCKDLDKSTISCKSTKPHFPKGLGTYIEDNAKKCSDGWGKNKGNQDSLKYNGGGPILAWGSNDDIYCKNTLYDVFKVELDDPRLIFNSDLCPPDECPCSVGTLYNKYPEPTEAFSKFKEALTGVVGMNEKCIGKFGSEEMNYCPLKWATAQVGDRIANIGHNASKTFRNPGTCDNK